MKFNSDIRTLRKVKIRPPLRKIKSPLRGTAREFMH